MAAAAPRSSQPSDAVFFKTQRQPVLVVGSPKSRSVIDELDAQLVNFAEVVRANPRHTAGGCCQATLVLNLEERSRWVSNRGQYQRTVSAHDGRPALHRAILSDGQAHGDAGNKAAASAGLAQIAKNLVSRQADACSIGAVMEGKANIDPPSALHRDCVPLHRDLPQVVTVTYGQL